MTRDERIQAVYAVALAVDGEVIENYSSRGMHGKTCYGIACDSRFRCIEEAIARGLKGDRVDNTGHKFIVYWKSIKRDE